MAAMQRCVVGEEIPDLAELVAAVSAPGHGAVLSFLGVVAVSVKVATTHAGSAAPVG